MNWLNIAYAFVFLCNLVFMVAAAYLLLRILDASERGQTAALNTAQQLNDVAAHLKVMVRHAFNELERTNDVHAARDNASGRALTELSFQVKTLMDRLHAEGARAGKGAAGEAGGTPVISEENVRAKLHAELNAALSKNHQLLDEIDQTKYRLKDASTINADLRSELTEVRGIKQAVVDRLVQRVADLEAELEKARERAKAAGRHAESNATQLDDIRAQIREQQWGDGGGSGGDADQAELIAAQQEQIDVLAQREQELMARVEELERAIQRNQTEKNFIEDRFLQLDAKDSAPRPAPTAPEVPPAA